MIRPLRRFQHFVRWHRLESELRHELEDHRAMKQEAFEHLGMSRRDAYHASRRALGNITLAREEARSVWLGSWLDSVCQDVKYAFRGFVRQPGITTVALVTLGSAIGLNTSLFTAFNAIVWRPWPVNEPARVVNVLTGRGQSGFTLAEYAHFAAEARSSAGLIAMRCIDGLSEGCALDLDDQEVRADFVTGNYFRVLRVPMIRGMGLTDEHDRRGAPLAVAVISEALWHRRFDADPGILGRQIRLNDVAFTIVGVAAHGFRGTSTDPADSRDRHSNGARGAVGAGPAGGRRRQLSRVDGRPPRGGPRRHGSVTADPESAAWRQPLRSGRVSRSRGPARGCADARDVHPGGPGRPDRSHDRVAM